MNQEVISQRKSYLLLCYNSPLLDAGKPLGEDDFFLASQLPRIPSNMTSEKLMKVVMPIMILLDMIIIFLSSLQKES